jgi:hypothetical protein
MQQLLTTHSVRSTDLKNRLKSVVVNSTAMSLCQIEGHARRLEYLLYLAFFPEFFWITRWLFSATVQSGCSCRVLVCRSGSVEALSSETMARDGICQFFFFLSFFSVDFSCVSLVWNYSNKHTYRGHSTRLGDGARPFSIYDTISVNGKIKNLYNFMIF